jgi:hypothetical protein
MTNMVARHQELAQKAKAAGSLEGFVIHTRAANAHAVAHVSPLHANAAALATGLAFDGWNESDHPRSDNGQFGSATSAHSSIGSKSEAQGHAHKSLHESDFTEGAPNHLGRQGSLRNYHGKHKGEGATASRLSVEPGGEWSHHEQYTAGTPDKVLRAGKNHEDLAAYLKEHAEKHAKK